MLDAMLMAIAAVALPPGVQRETYIAESYEPDALDAGVDQNVLLDDALFSAQDLRLFWLQPPSGQLHKQTSFRAFHCSWEPGSDSPTALRGGSHRNRRSALLLRPAHASHRTPPGLG